MPNPRQFLAGFCASNNRGMAGQSFQSSSRDYSPLSTRHTRRALPQQFLGGGATKEMINRERKRHAGVAVRWTDANLGLSAVLFLARALSLRRLDGRVRIVRWRAERVSSRGRQGVEGAFVHGRSGLPRHLMLRGRSSAWPPTEAACPLVECAFSDYS
jgi:hypothetical protein